MNQEPEVWQWRLSPRAIVRLEWSKTPTRQHVDQLLDHLDLLLKHRVYPTEAELRRRTIEGRVELVTNFARSLERSAPDAGGGE